MQLTDELLEGLSKVNTALIEVVSDNAENAVQCWYHYNEVKINSFPDGIIFIRFFYCKKSVASFGVKASSIKLYRELNIPELKDMAKHYHILVSNA